MKFGILIAALDGLEADKKDKSNFIDSRKFFQFEKLRQRRITILYSMAG
jgi:hypothetical protein